MIDDLTITFYYNQHINVMTQFSKVFFYFYCMYLLTFYYDCRALILGLLRVVENSSPRDQN